MGERLGTVVDMGGCHVVLTTDSYEPDGITGRITMQEMDEEPDMPTLSSCSHLVIGNGTIIHNGGQYKALGTIPDQCKYKVLPIVAREDIVGDIPDADPMFLSQGYAKEYRDALCIVMPQDYDGVLMPDMLVKNIDGDTYTGYSGRTYQISGVRHKDGRCIYPTSMTEPEGEAVDLPYTYTNTSLKERCRVLNERLHTHAKDKVSSICASLEALSDRIANASNPYEASQLYDDVSRVLTHTRHLS